MRKSFYIFLTLIPLIIGCESSNPSQQSPSSDPSLAFADSLLQLLSLEEKVGQMTNLSLMAIAEGEFWARRDTVILSPEKMKLYLDSFKVGSIQNLGTYPFGPAEWRQNIQIIQDYVRENTEHKIPVLYGIDAVHGANYSAGSTLFPQQISIAASRSREVASEIARITSYEMRASGIPWNYAPVLDVTKKPLWGRTFETFGEDTYISAELGVAMIKGGGADSLTSPYSSLACLKHFLGYGAPHNGKDRAAVYLPQRIVHQDYLPPFVEAIEAGALTIMVSSNSLNGVASHADKNLLTSLLKDELGFKGFVISDWNDIDNLIKTHQVAENEREAVKISVNAGLDMCMEPYDASFATHLMDLVKDGEVSQERVDDAVRRILYVKHKVGLFDQIQSDPEIYPEYGGDSFDEIARKTAVESITLLKNEGNSLPMSKSEKILLTGYGSHSLNCLNGAWSRTWSGQDTTFNDWEKLTLKQALEAKAGAGKVDWSAGVEYDMEIDISAAARKAKRADRIVVVLSELPSTEKPSDIDELDFPDAQVKLVEELAKAGKPITLILLEGRPRLIREIEPLVESIILAYLPGNEGGRAIADILYGDENPSGRLPFTYPRYSGSIWSYDHAKADVRDKGFGFEAYDPQYPFGFGLSYTDFAFSNLELSHDSLSVNETITVTVDVKNTGSKSGKVVSELYLSDHFASIVPKNKALRGFEKVQLAPDEMQRISFTLSAEDLAFVNMDLESVVEAGDFSVQIDTLKASFYLTEDYNFTKGQ